MKKRIGIFAGLVISQCLPFFVLADTLPSNSDTPDFSGYTSVYNTPNTSDNKANNDLGSLKNNVDANKNNFQSNNNSDKKNSVDITKPSSGIVSKDQIAKDFALKADIQYKLSPVEKMFNAQQASDQAILRQFGYDSLGSNYNYNSNNKASKDYKLVIGDKINIYFWDDNEKINGNSGSKLLKPNTNVMVNDNGAISLFGLGTILVKGETLSTIEQDIKAKLSEKFPNINVRVTVNNSETIPVFVMGNIKQPGVVYLPQSATFLDVLNLAGGINKDGSFRDIQYINSVNKTKKAIDLYDVLINGNVPNIQIKARDVIVVKSIGNVVAISNGVKHPGIYEFKQGENLKTLVNYAGGFLPTVNRNDIQIESFDPLSNERNLTEINQLELNKMLVKDGDFIQFKNLYNVAENVVTLEGNVKHPGKFQYKKGMKLSDIIKSQDDLFPNTYFCQAIISRTKGIDREGASIPVSLTDFLKGSVDPELKPMDTVKVYTNTKMFNIEISGSINNPGSIPFKNGMTLKDVLSIANFDTTQNNLVAEITNPLDESKNVRTVYLYDMLKQKDICNDTELKAGDKILFRQITDKEIIKTVKILGKVNNPGIYKVYSGMKLKEAIEIAGGLSPNAYLKGLSFYRPSLYISQKKATEDSVLRLQEDISMKVNTLESMSDPDQKTDSTKFMDNQQNLINVLKERSANEYGRISINITSNNLSNLTNNENLEIEDGDEIFVPTMPQHVAIMGEVYNQSAIAYNSDKNVKYYIDNVGGITKQANKKEIYIIRANGSANKVKNQELEFPEPGDTIVIPRKVVIPINVTSILKDLTQIGINALNTIYILTKI